MLTVTVDGWPVRVAEGASAAAAVLAAGWHSIRRTPVGGLERGPFCMTGACFECLAEIDGVPNRQSCLVEVRAGMQIRRQIGARRIDPAL
jgi:NADH dehydrogenase/NADH:ubiquinone oxidoreductase subunit G